MVAEAGRLRVHLFVMPDNRTQPECFDRQLLGDRLGNRGLGYPRDLNKILADDYAILWCQSKVYGVWRISEARENIVPEAWGRKYPVQARVQHVTDPIEKDYCKIEPLLGIPKKEDYYDGDQAREILRFFGVLDKIGVGPVDYHPTSVRKPPQAVLNGSQAFDPSAIMDPTSEYRPPFFDRMLRTKEWSNFEDYTHALLRSLGIHNLHPIPRDNQAGRPDGIFTDRKSVV